MPSTWLPALLTILFATAITARLIYTQLKLPQLKYQLITVAWYCILWCIVTGSTVYIATGAHR